MEATRKLRRDLQATRNLRRDLLESRVVFRRATHQPESWRWEVAQQLGVSSTKSRGEMPRAFTSRRKRNGVAAGRGRGHC